MARKKDDVNDIIQEEQIVCEHAHYHEVDQSFTWQNYKPLIIILAFCAVLAFAHGGGFSGAAFMAHFFIFFALFKFFDLKGFVEGFKTYDLVAMRYEPYAYAYPFIEFALGFAYFYFGHSILLNLITMAIMGVSAVGVVQALRDGKPIKCVCLGTSLNVPLSTISVIENIGMGLMALLGLFL